MGPHVYTIMDLCQELTAGNLSMLKAQLGQLQMIGRFGYGRDCYMFVDISNLSRHFKLHTMPGIFCDICEKSFKDNTAFECDQQNQDAK